LLAGTQTTRCKFNAAHTNFHSARPFVPSETELPESDNVLIQPLRGSTLTLRRLPIHLRTDLQRITPLPPSTVTILARFAYRE
jgi:hypothetical protein